MKSKTLLILYAALAFLPGCTDSDAPVRTPFEEGVPISWNVSVIGTRALMENDAELQAACTPGIGGEAIAIWGSHNRAEGFIFDDTRLTYETKSSASSHLWNYVDEEDQYWLYFTKYSFWACFPAGMDEVSIGSDGKELVVTDFDTKEHQVDLMVARAEVDTDADSFNGNAPVPLQMNHALAAVKFKVKSEDGRATTLKSLSLSGLYAKGDFVYQSKSTPAVTDWANHSGNTASYDWTGTLTFGGTAADVTGYTGASPLTQYAEDGFILVIPQQNCTPALDIATTDKVYDRAVLGEVDFEPGKQYVYTITVTPADALKVTLRIKPWNELNSSYDITF